MTRCLTVPVLFSRPRLRPSLRLGSKGKKSWRPKALSQARLIISGQSQSQSSVIPSKAPTRGMSLRNHPQLGSSMDLNEFNTVYSVISKEIEP